MPATQKQGEYAALADPATLTIERILPGSLERAWAYLTDSELRRQWLARGEMKLEVGAPFELVWRNDELTTPPAPRPEGFEPEHRMTCRILEVDPPRRLAFTWGENGEVSFDLRQEGDRVRLALTHRRPPSRDVLLKVAAGWHTHLDILVARASGELPAPFWDRWLQLHEEYDQRLPR